ncbi:MAG: Mannosyl transferase [candidate division WS6 bacterium GW2011_GWF2_39_15]|uniref:Mannosyl transferase n=1 Tax=candidate division WS6 bacterium GW2011_GWF2_39_15 TaxID=1619100 RepID=A0A0G0MS86_9BACT|nr:MAG: Mannosyl transferase [candidate division WS6 bacterium GW2011_GWF2_39_15]
MSKDRRDLKVAIVHDWIYKIGGGEKCVETLCEMFPQSDFFALFGDIKYLRKASPVIAGRKVTFSPLNRIPFLRKFYRYTYFLWPLLIENFDFRDYDLVISTSSCVAKGAITSIDTLHICYMFSPMRYAWDQSKEYFDSKYFNWWKRKIITWFLHFIRMWDVTSTDRIDYIIPISNMVAKRIRKYYRREPAPVIAPPVYIEHADYQKKKEDFYIAIAPFEPNKGGELAVGAAMKYGFNLKIIGTGSLKRKLEKRVRGFKNIEFLNQVSEEMKWDYLARAKCLLFCGVEDFGIAPIEAIASGTPVVAYKGGGALDYVIDGFNGSFFVEKNSEAVKEAIDRVEVYYSKNRFSTKKMNEYAKRFSKERFKKEFTEVSRKLMYISEQNSNHLSKN